MGNSYNMQNMNFNAPNQGNGNMGPNFGLQQMNSFGGPQQFGNNNMQMGGQNGMQQMNQQSQPNNGPGFGMQ